MQIQNRLRATPFVSGLGSVASAFLFLAIASLCGCGASSQPGDADKESGSLAQPVALHSLTSSTGIKQLLVPSGAFKMGSGVAEEGPRHTVELSAFVMDQFEVQQSEFTSLQIPDASHFKGADRPVEMVRWSEAALACNARSQAEGLDPCYDEATFECNFAANGYRLPTEAEWEYAARAGDDGEYPPHEKQRELTRIACYAENSNEQTQPNGARQANAWGFFDLLGNVAEWCHDVYADDAYANAALENPTGPASGPLRVLRGGSWNSPANECRVTARQRDEPGIDDACFAQDAYGFRMVRRPSDEELLLLHPVP